MAWKGTDNLKPLEPDIHGTGRWAYLGKNLDHDDVKRLTAKGVDWEKDIMPDGRLKHPKFRLRRINNRKNALAEATKFTVKETDELKTRYDSLPDPKPPYFQWAAEQEIAIHYANVKRIAMHAPRDSDRIKALAVLLDNGLVKPKSVVENLPAQPEMVDLDKVIEIALAMKGISLDKFRQFIESESNVPAQA